MSRLLDRPGNMMKSSAYRSSGRKDLLKILIHTDLRHHEGLDTIGIGNMWPNTEIDHRATTIDSRGSTIGDFCLDDVFLVFVIL